MEYKRTYLFNINRKCCNFENKKIDMKKIRYRLVYNRKRHLNAQGKAVVQCECSLDGRKVYATTRIYVKPSEWDYENGQVSDAHPNYKDLNAYLFEFMFNLEKAELDIWKRGGIPTLQQIKDVIVGNRQSEITFDSFAKDSVLKSDRRKGSKENILNTLKTLKQYKPSYNWDDITYSFIKDFERYLRMRGSKVNTIAKHLTCLKTMINEAIRQGMMTSNPFLKFKIRHEEGAHSFLTNEELGILEGLRLVRDKLQHTLDAFLFCCYVGLRFSDFKSLKAEHIIMRDGVEWLKFKSQKTGADLDLPLYLLGGGKAMEIVNKYPTLKEFTSIGCNADVNRKLKEIMNEAGIRKRVTFHSSRHTCATTLIYDGVPITSVQKVLGHKKISTTQIYSEVHQQTLVKDLSNAFTV